jgi:zinc transporter ZupT
MIFNEGFVSAALIAACPSLFMLGASYLAVYLKCSEFVEASIQNLAAGLIFGAVALEFFPKMKEEIENGRFVAVSVGFIVGVIALFAIERIISALDEGDSNEEDPLLVSVPSETTPLQRLNFESDGIKYSAEALADPNHRQHVTSHVIEVGDIIKNVSSKCSVLLNSSSKPLSGSDNEELFEDIDENIHHLHYKIDHCIRLLQGSEFRRGSKARRDSSKPPFENAEEVVRLLKTLEDVAAHIIQHTHSTISAEELVEVYGHLVELRDCVDGLHSHVDNASKKWRRSHPFPEMHLGDSISTSLVIPVWLDSTVDGFIIGIACATSLNAGIIMAIVNSMEMSFLGMAYSPRYV